MAYYVRANRYDTRNMFGVLLRRLEYEIIPHVPRRKHVVVIYKLNPPPLYADEGSNFSLLTYSRRGTNNYLAIEFMDRVDSKSFYYSSFNF